MYQFYGPVHYYPLRTFLQDKHLNHYLKLKFRLYSFTVRTPLKNKLEGNKMEKIYIL